jgi:hypothetical protein
MDPPPRLRDVMKGALSLWDHSFEGELQRMAGVRRPLLRVVHSQLADGEATDRVRADVREHPAAAQATLSYLQRAHEAEPGYITDRACRILEAAMGSTEPAGISPPLRDLYERERTLGWLPLEQAFAEIARAAPEARNLVTELAQREAKGSESLALIEQLRAVVGPLAENRDLLVQTPLANRIVFAYLAFLEGGASARDPTRSIWQWTDTVRDRRADRDREQRSHPPGADTP